MKNHKINKNKNIVSSYPFGLKLIMFIYREKNIMEKIQKNSLIKSNIIF